MQGPGDDIREGPSVFCGNEFFRKSLAKIAMIYLTSGVEDLGLAKHN